MGLGGVFTIKPSSGPHKQGESLPIALFLRNRLKYVLTMKEVETICKQRLIKIDGKLRTDPKFPTGFMDVIQIEKTGENFRIIYDVKGRFIVHRITAAEAKYKLCRVREVKTGPKNVPFLYTSDGRTIRFPDPAVRVHDSVQVDIATGKIQDTIRFDTGNLCMITGGANSGRVGTIMSRERHSLQSHPNGAVTPIDEPAVAAARADHLATKFGAGLGYAGYAPGYAAGYGYAGYGAGYGYAGLGY